MAGSRQAPPFATAVESPRPSRTVTSTLISVSDERPFAAVSVLFLRDDFASAITGLEALGDIQSKQLREGAAAADADLPEEPDAPIEVVLREGEGSGADASVIAAIVVPSVVVAAAVAAGLTIATRRRRAA